MGLLHTSIIVLLVLLVPIAAIIIALTTTGDGDKKKPAGGLDNDATLHLAVATTNPTNTVASSRTLDFEPTPRDHSSVSTIHLRLNDPNAGTQLSGTPDRNHVTVKVRNNCPFETWVDITGAAGLTSPTHVAHVTSQGDALLTVPSKYVGGRVRSWYTKPEITPDNYVKHDVSTGNPQYGLIEFSARDNDPSGKHVTGFNLSYVDSTRLPMSVQGIGYQTVGGVINPKFSANATYEQMTNQSTMPKLGSHPLVSWDGKTVLAPHQFCLNPDGSHGQNLPRYRQHKDNPHVDCNWRQGDFSNCKFAECHTFFEDELKKHCSSDPFSWPPKPCGPNTKTMNVFACGAAGGDFPDLDLTRGEGQSLCATLNRGTDSKDPNLFYRPGTRFNPYSSWIHKTLVLDDVYSFSFDDTEARQRLFTEVYTNQLDVVLCPSHRTPDGPHIPLTGETKIFTGTGVQVEFDLDFRADWKYKIIFTPPIDLTKVTVKDDENKDLDKVQGVAKCAKRIVVNYTGPLYQGHVTLQRSSTNAPLK